MLDQNLWAICGFGSGLNISFLTHQCLGSTEPLRRFGNDISTCPDWKNFQDHFKCRCIINHHLSSFIIIYHHLSSFIIIYHHLSRSFDCNLENVPRCHLGQVAGAQVPECSVQCSVLRSKWPRLGSLSADSRCLTLKPASREGFDGTLGGESTVPWISKGINGGSTVDQRWINGHRE